MLHLSPYVNIVRILEDSACKTASPLTCLASSLPLSFHLFNPECVHLQTGVGRQLSVLLHQLVAPARLKAAAATVHKSPDNRVALRQRTSLAEKRAIVAVLIGVRVIPQEVSSLRLLLGAVQLCKLCCAANQTSFPTQVTLANILL